MYHKFGISKYPTTRGTSELRVTIANWLCNRFNLPKETIDEKNNILPVNGTREALFAIAQTIINKSGDPIAILPNPFYQIYEGAVLLAKAQPYYLICAEENIMFPFKTITGYSGGSINAAYLASQFDNLDKAIPLLETMWKKNQINFESEGNLLDSKSYNYNA